MHQQINWQRASKGEDNRLRLDLHKAPLMVMTGRSRECNQLTLWQLSDRRLRRRPSADTASSCPGPVHPAHPAGRKSRHYDSTCTFPNRCETRRQLTSRRVFRYCSSMGEIMGEKMGLVRQCKSIVSHDSPLTLRQWRGRRHLAVPFANWAGIGSARRHGCHASAVYRRIPASAERFRRACWQIACACRTAL